MKISFSFSNCYCKTPYSHFNFIFAFTTLIFLFASGQESANPQMVTGKNAMLSIRPTDDFKLTADTGALHWKVAPWIKLQQRKNSGVHYQTKAKLLYSAQGIYVMFWCEDERISATLREDFANLFKEDVVEIFLWPDETTPIYLEYELSPLDQELVILVPNINGNFYGWRPWHYEDDRKTNHLTQVLDNKSWVAEFFIPYKLLQPLVSAPPQAGTRWRANIYRIDYDNGLSLWTWQPIQKDFHDYKLFGTIVFEK
jgi:hypothetical protein